jgi:hypothetical protein
VKHPTVRDDHHNYSLVHSLVKNKKQYPIYQLPPNVTITNDKAKSAVRCHFSSQSHRKYKDHAELAICAADKCDKSVYVQCFLHLILGTDGEQVSNTSFFTLFFYYYLFSHIAF